MDWKTTSTVLEKLRDYNDRSAWGVFVGHFHAPILRFALRLGLTRADAEDAAQEALAAFAQSYRDGRYDRTRGRLKDWLFGIAHRQILNIRRRHRSRAGIVSIDAGGGAGSAATAAGAIDVPVETQVQFWAAEWESHVYNQCLQQVKREVEAQTMEIFQLVLKESMSNQAVAERLGIAPSVVYQSKHRVLKRLRELAEKYQDC